MKYLFFAAVLITIALSCTNQPKQTQLPIIGTWELISATSTGKNITVSTFNPATKMIKIINPTHFAFFSHAIGGGKDSANNQFSAGGGAYTLADSTYTENLEYFGDPRWENHKFTFTVSLSGDTLTQKGVEKIDSLGVDHIIVEKYKRIKN